VSEDALPLDIVFTALCKKYTPSTGEEERKKERKCFKNI
jgi:hypothetical protein